jgi:hypothetical protein
MAGHTPGPWAVTPMVRGCTNAFYISGNLAANNSEVDIGTVGPSLNPSMEANARLIAAAPDFLDAAGQMLADYQTSQQHHPGHILVSIDAFAAMKAAHIKATGAAS